MTRKNLVYKASLDNRGRIEVYEGTNPITEAITKTTFTPEAQKRIVTVNGRPHYIPSGEYMNHRAKYRK